MQYSGNERVFMDQSLPSVDAWETTKLYQQHAEKVFHYFYQHLSNSADSEDLLLEVFLKVWEHEQVLENMLEQEQRAWLWTVARNKLIDSYRRAGRQRSIPLEHIAEPLDIDERAPESLALQQEVLQLRFTAGLHCAEIAVVLNKREGAIRTMLSRALNILRQYYEQ